MNDRYLTSRNKREGWYAGKDGWSRCQHHRTRERWKTLRWPGPIPSGHVVFLCQKAKAVVHRIPRIVPVNYRPAVAPPTLMWIDEASDLQTPSIPVSQLQNITDWRPT